MSAPTARDVAVVIPVLGDTAPLQRLLDTLHALQQPPAGITVVDGGGTAECRNLCARYPIRYATTRPGRGHQLHQGALQSEGDVLWFLHADAQVPADAVGAILAAVNGGAAGGHFRFRFAGPRAWHKSLLAALINLRVRFGVPYGDQGLFATRTAYRAAGGFPDVPLFEEVPLVRGLRRRGRFVTLDQCIEVSPRRWERDGWLRRTLENRLLALAYLAGASPHTLARRYRTHQTAAPSPARNLEP